MQPCTNNIHTGQTPHPPTLPQTQKNVQKENGRQTWTKVETENLQREYDLYLLTYPNTPINWSEISAKLPNRSALQCRVKWESSLDPTVKRGKWSSDEVTLLFNAVMNKTPQQGWQEIADQIPGRTIHQCHTRWMVTHKKGREEWTPGEDAQLMRAVANARENWADVSRYFFGKSPSQCKARWEELQSRKTPEPVALQQQNNPTETASPRLLAECPRKEDEPPPEPTLPPPPAVIPNIEDHGIPTQSNNQTTVVQVEEMVIDQNLEENVQVEEKTLAEEKVQAEEEEEEKEEAPASTPKRIKLTHEEYCVTPETFIHDLLEITLHCLKNRDRVTHLFSDSNDVIGFLPNIQDNGKDKAEPLSEEMKSWLN